MSIDLNVVGYKSLRGREGYGYNATLVYKGKKIALAIDDASGGCVHYQPLGKVILDANGNYVQNAQLKENTLLLKELEKEVEALPALKTQWGNLDMNLDLYVEELINDLQRQKTQSKGVQIKRGDTFATVGYKESIPNFIKKYRNGLELIQKIYDDMIAKGETVLNTEYLKSIGIVTK